jgi:hypothetical protein
MYPPLKFTWLLLLVILLFCTLEISGRSELDEDTFTLTGATVTVANACVPVSLYSQIHVTRSSLLNQLALFVIGHRNPRYKTVRQSGG